MELTFRPARKKIRVSQIVLFIVILFFLVLTLVPLGMMLIKSVKSPTQDVVAPFWLSFPFRWRNFAEAWKYIDYTLLNTFIIAFAVTFLLLLIGAMASYGMTRYRLPCKNFVLMLFLALLMIPGVLTLIPQYQLVAVTYNMMNTRMGVILPTVAGSIPMAVFLIKTFMESLPKDLYEAGLIDGASNLRMFFIITLPLSIPILVTQGIMTFMGTYNDYLWPLLILRQDSLKTTSVILKSLTDTLFNETNSMTVAIAGYTIASLPMILIFAVSSKQFVKGLTSGAIKM